MSGDRVVPVGRGTDAQLLLVANGLSGHEQELSSRRGCRLAVAERVLSAGAARAVLRNVLQAGLSNRLQRTRLT